MKTLIKLGLSRLSNQGVINLAHAVDAGLTAAVATYPSPFPTLTTLSTAVTAFQDAVTKYGPKGNRGSKLDHYNLLATRATLEAILTQLAWYCQNTTPYDATALATTGFVLKKVSAPQGVLQAPQSVHRFISRQLTDREVKLRWKKPLDVAINGNVKVYRVFRGTTSNFSAATQVGLTTRVSFIDTPPIGIIIYYWIVAVNNVGDSPESDVCMVAMPVATP